MAVGVILVGFPAVGCKEMQRRRRESGGGKWMRVGEFFSFFE